MEKKHIYFLLFFNLFISNCLSQNIEQQKAIENKLSDIFMGFDTTLKPTQIEEKYFGPLDVEPGDKKRIPEKNIIKFKTHPFISNFYSGNFNVNYLYDKKYFDKYGLYQIKMNIFFDDKIKCISEYKKLTEYFELFGVKKIVTTVRNDYNISLIDNEKTLFLKNSYKEFPRLEIYYGYEETENISYITITLMKSWNNTVPRIRLFGN
ncbi:hypothetical protein [Flavobacterium sp. H122]|uniref:hypothetical protein n=1 Tax=Flavobacterium sp. H122 TaxID=2529860 RepID=UPI0010A9FD60|nr:hypothetical protein [Flavobacterium sp. H122]